MDKNQRIKYLSQTIGSALGKPKKLSQAEIIKIANMMAELYSLIAEKGREISKVQKKFTANIKKLTVDVKKKSAELDSSLSVYKEFLLEKGLEEEFINFTKLKRKKV